jgi:hypothetical protein
MKTLVIITGVWVGAACAAFAQTQATPQETTRPAAPTTAPAPEKASGSLVFVDPTTRKIRKPAPSEIGAQRSQSRAAAAAAARPAPAPVLIHGPGGATGILLDDNDMSYMVATRKADGKIAVECVTGHTAADRETQPARAAAETK